MVEEKLFIPLLLGTNRAGSNTEKAARWLLGEVEKRDDIETKVFDAHTFAFPKNDCCQAIADTFPEYREAISRSDALMIIAPEYNHGYSGALKSMLDLLAPKEYMHRAVALSGVSAGILGGARMIEQLSLVCRELGLVVTKRDLLFANAREAFSEDGSYKNADEQRGRVKIYLDELVWMARALKWGRENLENSK